MPETQVSIRAYVPVWTFLYVLQFLLMPLIAQDYWVSNLFGNTMYLLALSYYCIITFLGYNGVSWALVISHRLTTDRITSYSLPQSNGGAIGADTCPGHHLAR